MLQSRLWNRSTVITAQHNDSRACPIESPLMWAVSRPSHASNLQNAGGHTNFIGDKFKYGRLDAGTDGGGHGDGMLGLS